MRLIVVLAVVVAAVSARTVVRRNVAYGGGGPAPPPAPAPPPTPDEGVKPKPDEGVKPKPDAGGSKPDAGVDKPDAGVDKTDGGDATTAAPAPGATCKVPERPEPQEGCYWVPTYDDQFCITGFECGSPPTEAPEEVTTKEPCKELNPFTDSDVDKRGSDPECETGNPGWGGDQSCRCKYTVKSRDDGGCTTRFWRTCKKGGEDGTDPFGPDGATVPPCPRLEFPEEKPGCMLVKMQDESGCDMIMNMCPEDNGSATGATGTGTDGAAPAGTDNGAPAQAPNPNPIAIAPAQPPPPAQQGGPQPPTAASGYKH